MEQLRTEEKPPRRHCLDLEGKHSLPEVWGLSDDDDEKYSEEEATGVPRGRKNLWMASLLPLPLSLLIRSLPDLPGEKESKEEEAVTGGNRSDPVLFSSVTLECCPGEEEGEEERRMEKLLGCAAR